MFKGIDNRSFVSTHSRPKAAGLSAGSLPCSQTGFNTQPPEGGWAVKAIDDDMTFSFNTQPPEGGW